MLAASTSRGAHASRVLDAASRRNAPASPRNDAVPTATPAPFTRDGSPALEAHLAHTCEKIAAGLRGLLPPHKLEAVLLGGGYGRGEGGVLHTPDSDRPYNDLEFYVFLRGNRHFNELRHGRALHVLGEILTPQAGVEVEFKIASLRELARRPVDMFSYDLVAGHRWLVGGEELLRSCAHHRDATRIPLCEATRLLMNRCTGLLLARERLQREVFSAADADFVRRNIAKAELALGDAVLVAFGEYHWSVIERHRRLERICATERLSWLDNVLVPHAAGVEFKLHPVRSQASRAELQAQHRELAILAWFIWEWIENRRLGATFQIPTGYAASRIDKWPDSPSPRNLALNFKALGYRACLPPKALRHPRERVLNALALLLWTPDITQSPASLARVQSELNTKSSDFPAL
ncbi:MAG: hypothetical protein ABIZ49_07710, partial [Opitutaceae bacterium]